MTLGPGRAKAISASPSERCLAVKRPDRSNLALGRKAAASPVSPVFVRVLATGRRPGSFKTCSSPRTSPVTHITLHQLPARRHSLNSSSHRPHQHTHFTPGHLRHTACINHRPSPRPVPPPVKDPDLSFRLHQTQTQSTLRRSQRQAPVPELHSVQPAQLHYCLQPHPCPCSSVKPPAHPQCPPVLNQAPPNSNSAWSLPPVFKTAPDPLSAAPSVRDA